MGKFTVRISERSRHTSINEGYCLICGTYGRLSPDHVPPKGAITITKVEQRHITEMKGLSVDDIRGVVSNNGSKFKTICHDCNNRVLGGNDDEIARVCKDLTSKISHYFQLANSPYSTIQTNVNSIRFARAMIGHVLAATSVEECKTEPVNTPYFEPLKRFVLGDDSAIDGTHDIYYWFYPFNMHISAKFVAFRNAGHFAFCSLLSFFPIAFMVTKKGEGTFPAHAHQLSLSDKFLYLNLKTRGFEFAQFPFNELKGDQIMAVHSSQAIVSYPIGR